MPAASKSTLIEDSQVGLDQLDPAQQSLAEALRVSFGILKLAMVGILIAYGMSGIFSVGSNEVALRLRFGDYVGAPGERVIERGTYFAAPFPIEQVIKVDTRPASLALERQFWYEIVEDNMGQARAGRSGPLNPLRDGSLLTGDMNIAHARWTVNYRVTDPVAFVTNVGDRPLAADIVSCAAQQGIVQATAQISAEQFLKGIVNREAALAIAQRRLDDMKTGISIEQLVLDKVSAPMSVVGSFDAVTTAEADRGQKIVAAQQDRARILGEIAGEAADALIALVETYEKATESRDAAAAADAERAIDEAIAALQVGDSKIGGEVARRISAAKTYRTQIVEQVKGDRDTFERMLPQFDESPRIVMSRMWEDAREQILTGDVETFYTGPGNLMLKMNRDPARQKERQQKQLKDLKQEQKSFNRKNSDHY